MKQAITVAFDFDDTLTARPEELFALAKMLRYRGDNVICVTARRSTVENEDLINELCEEHGCPMQIFFSNLTSKVDHMEALGVKVHIWIDDAPYALVHGRI